MVLQITRTLEGSGDSNSNSSGSQKRTFTNQFPTRPESSISGYSADREDPSISPPVVSIDFHGRHTKADRDRCPKRQKRNEIQYAASTVKEDLERAGKEFLRVHQNLSKTTCLGKISIDLEGVRLLYSKDVKKPMVSSNVSAQASDYDLETLVRACWDAYPSNFSLLKHDKEFVEGQYSDRSTSSVSDTESDSVDSGNQSNQALLIPPLLEDSSDASKPLTRVSNIQMNACNIISCATNAVTMSEMLQLSGSARLVTLSSSPFTIVHANGAFIRFSETDPSKIIGSPFSDIFYSEPNDGKVLSLPECMVASSAGKHKKFFLKEALSDKGVECHVKVSPIVNQKSTNREFTAVTHFGIEVSEEEIASASSSRGSSPDMIERAVGVMG